MQVRGVAEVAALAASPVAAELLDDVVVVDMRAHPAAASGRWPDLSALATLPCVVVGITGSPGDADERADLLVPDEASAERVAAAVRAHPLAATALVLHLRAAEHLGVLDALVAESTTYSMLQAGPEHRRWLDDRAQRRPRAGRAARDEGGVTDRVRLARDGARVHIALARPEARNAVDAAMQQALVDALATVGDGDEVLLTGDGPVFSAGGDLDEFGSLADPATAHLVRLRRSPARALARVAGRTTAVVQGSCHGAGVELPAFARRVVARPGTTFTLPEVGMGLIPGAGGTVSIPRRIGRPRTAWLAITGEALDAPTALAWGLVDEIADG